MGDQIDVPPLAARLDLRREEKRPPALLREPTVDLSDRNMLTGGVPVGRVPGVGVAGGDKVPRGDSHPSGGWIRAPPHLVFTRGRTSLVRGGGLVNEEANSS